MQKNGETKADAKRARNVSIVGMLVTIILTVGVFLVLYSVVLFQVTPLHLPTTITSTQSPTVTVTLTPTIEVTDNTDTRTEIFNEAVRLNNLGTEANAQGRYDDALDYYQEALNLVREINERRGEGVILNNIGAVYRLQGEYGAALDFYQQALAMQREEGNRAGEGDLLFQIANLLVEAGNLTEAQEYYDRALTIAQETGNTTLANDISQAIATVKSISQTPTRDTTPNATALRSTENAIRTQVAQDLSTAQTATALAWTSTPTTEPVQIADVAFRVQSISGNEIGNGRLSVYFADQVSFPQTTRVELELEFDNYYITPTPFGPRTVVPANTRVSPSLNPSTPFRQLTPTPRLPQFESDPEAVEIYELMGASLVCLTSSFTGCDEETDFITAQRITLNGAKWTWIITPQNEVRGSQDLRLELWRIIRIGDGPQQVEVVWEHPFQIHVHPEDENTIALIVTENISTLIGAISAIIVALISGGYLINKNRSKSAIPSQNNAPSVFISYRRGVSAGFAHTLHDKLEARGANVFIDVEDIHAGSFSDYIKASIVKSDYFVVVLAPETLKSEWVVKEVKYAHEHNKTIIPVLVNEFDLYGSEVTSDLEFLQTQNAVTLLPQYVDAAVGLIAKYIGLASDAEKGSLR